MYESVKSRIKYCNELSNEYTCALGVRQGECLSPFMFSMFIYDLENVFIHKGTEEIDVNMFKIFMLLYADDIVVFSTSVEDLQYKIDLLAVNCYTGKLK